MRLRLISGVLVVLLPLAAVHAVFFGRDWTTTQQEIETEFPAARHMTTSALHQAIHGKRPKAPLLLDIRAPAEYRISHLREARLAPDEKAALALVRGRDKGEPIVVYCSVGWRSSAVVEALQRAGFRDVRNLKGGIFTWANEGRPLYRGDHRASSVHPFNRDWGRLLKPDYRSRAP